MKSIKRKPTTPTQHGLFKKEWDKLPEAEKMKYSKQLVLDDEDGTSELFMVNPEFVSTKKLNFNWSNPQVVIAKSGEEKLDDEKLAAKLKKSEEIRETAMKQWEQDPRFK